MVEYLEKQKGGGRPKGSGNLKIKYKVIFYNKETNKLEERQYSAVSQMTDIGIKNGDHAKRIMTGYRADKTERNGENSFYQRWGHIQIYRC
tara:strand:+ start:1391 stop:1663 length:273 start_codon:yes stop_codon:yes gene_type:complete